MCIFQEAEPKLLLFSNRLVTQKNSVKNPDLVMPVASVPKW